MPLFLTHRQRHEGAAFERLMSQEAVKRSGARRSCIKPARVCGGRDYSGGNILSWLSRKGIRYTIPRKRNAAIRVVATMVIIGKYALGLIGTVLHHARLGGGSKQ